MASVPTISIPLMTMKESIYLPHSLYGYILVAIADKATELRIETWQENLGKVWMKCAGNEFEMVPTLSKTGPRAVKAVERQLVSFLNPIRRLFRWLRRGREDIFYRINVNGRFTQMLASFRPEAVVLHFIDPEKASEEATRMVKELVASGSPPSAGDLK
jgi:hypothetical protein